MSDDLVKRLLMKMYPQGPIMEEAANELARLRERIAELEKERDERPWIEKQQSNIMRKMDIEISGWKYVANEQTNLRILAESRIVELEKERDSSDALMADFLTATARIASLEAELDVANRKIAETRRTWTGQFKGHAALAASERGVGQRAGEDNDQTS